MSEIKNYTMKVDGKEILLTDKSHAGIFRNFFGHFLTTDVQKTLETIALVNIRTSDSELFIAKNNSKKKNIPASDGVWIYTHLTPDAMRKAYDKFLAGWHGTYVPNAPKVAPNVVDDITAEPETNDDLTPPEFIPTPETDPVMLAKNAIAQIDYGVDFADLVPTQKTKVTKAYNKSLETPEVIEPEEQDALDL